MGEAPVPPQVTAQSCPCAGHQIVTCSFPVAAQSVPRGHQQCTVGGIQGEQWLAAGSVTCPGKKKKNFLVLGWQLKCHHCLHAGIDSTLGQVQFCVL